MIYMYSVTDYFIKLIIFVTKLKNININESNVLHNNIYRICLCKLKISAIYTW